MMSESEELLYMHCACTGYGQLYVISTLISLHYLLQRNLSWKLSSAACGWYYFVRYMYLHPNKDECTVVWASPNTYVVIYWVVYNCLGMYKFG